MARWYARFDGGSVSALDNANSTEGYFTKLRIGASSASAALLRDGLIASKSALSTDVYADLDGVNINGTLGTYFPDDFSGKTVSIPTYVSWSNGYSSTLEGIKTPTTNTYGVADSVNYSKRPTGSVSYTSSAWVTALSPADPIGVSYSTYYSASAAVRTIVDTIQTTPGGVAQTPFTRPGTDPYRTIYSLWSNPGTDYFAWDDFSPGQPTATMDIDGLNKGTSPPEIYPGGDPVNTDIVIKFSVSSFEYPNDGNIDGKIGINMTVHTSQSNDNLAALQLNGGTHGGPLVIGDYVTGNGPTNPRQGGSSTWTWNDPGDQYTGILTWTLGLTAGEYTLNCDGRIYDVIITSHVGSTRFVTTFPTTATNQFIVKAGNPQ